MKARLAFLSAMASFAATLAWPANAADIAWHATSVAALRKGQNSETRTKAVFKNGEQAEVVGYGTNHAETNGSRPITGIAVIRFEDLSSIVLRNEIVYDAGAHASSGTGEFIGGSGRFWGITGKVSCATRYSSHEAWETDCSGSYSLPSK